MAEASKTVRNIKSLYVENMQAVVDGGQLMYRLDAKISFAVDDHNQAGQGTKEKVRH